MTLPPQDSTPSPGGTKSRVLLPMAILMASLAVFCFALNWTSPWESDQPSKAAQIVVIANENDYFLGQQLPDYYRLRLFPLYYSASAILHRCLALPIFTTMNLSSVAMGVIAVLALAYAARNAFGISPLWTSFVLLAMPLVVINSTYGNEVIWAYSLFALSLWMLTTQSPSLRYGAAAIFAASSFCRIDMILVAPYWAAWAYSFGTAGGAPRLVLRQLLIWGVVFVGTVGLLWLALLRAIPSTSTTFPWDTNWKLLVSYLSYPFNPSVTVIAVVGLILLFRAKPRYALMHLLLLAPLVFYFRNLASPKYITALVLFYAFPAAYLLQSSGARVRVGLAAAVLIWTVVGVSPFGIFAPSQASLWFVPTVDGPLPIGGYIDFYGRSRAGFYQAKQREYLAQAEILLRAAQKLPPDVRLLAHYSANAFPLVLLELNRKSAERPFIMPPKATDDDDRLLMTRLDYITFSKSFPGREARMTGWLKKGQVRSVLAENVDALPAVIEMGEQVPVGSDPNLGRRILFATEYYRGFKIFELPQFIAAYRTTSWLARDRTLKIPADWKPIYTDQHFLGFDGDVGGDQRFGYPWPARYFNLKAPSKNL